LFDILIKFIKTLCNFQNILGLFEQFIDERNI